MTGEPINRAMHLGEETAAMNDDDDIDLHVEVAVDTFFGGEVGARLAGRAPGT